MTLTQPKVRRWLAKWTRVLKLQDWEIVVAIRPREKLKGADGLFDHTLARKYAFIQLSEPWAEPELNEFYDPEHTLVHELIHIHFAPFQSNVPDSPEDVAQEQAVDAWAASLIFKEKEAADLRAKLREARKR